MCERYIHLLPLARFQLGTWPATQACALTGNRTVNFLVCGLALNPLSHANHGSMYYFNWLNIRTESSFLGLIEIH